MPTERTMTVTSLVVLTPTKHTDTHNIVRIHRANELDKENVLHVAGGSHTGIIVNKLQELPIDADAGVVLSFQVWLSDSRTNSRRQETRVIRYRLSKNVPEADGKNAANNFFSKILNPFPKTYVAFMKRALSLLQGGFEELDGVELDMRVAADEEQMAMPDAHQYGSDSEVEEVTAAHVQEVLEHAYPNGLPVFTIAELLRSTEEEITAFLYDLEGQGIITKAGDNEWIRVDTRHVEESLASVKGNITHGGTVRAAKGEEPTVAIICCLFSEKQCIDTIIEDAQTIHRYKSGGDSNVYTVGKIGKHRVVATKLAIIGDSREAKTSAGSITTRLLGNYQKIEHVLIVGIGGAVPHVTEAALHGRLGDVVVADSYFYAHDILTDRKTERFAGFDFKKYVPNDPTLLSLARASPKELAREWNDATRTVVQTLGGEFARPNSATDVLAVPVGGGNVVVVAHANEGRTEESVAHIAPVGALCSIKKTEEQDSETTAHFFREQFAREHALRAYDGGVDQVIASIQGNRIDSWTLIRGCADYQNGQSRSAKLWQGYAAARAAGLAQALVKRLPA